MRWRKGNGDLGAVKALPIFAPMGRLRTVTMVTFLAWSATPASSRAQIAAVNGLRDRIGARIARVAGAEVAVSCRDLATGDSLDIGANVDFHPPSTMKIPVMLEVLRAPQTGRLPFDPPILLLNHPHPPLDPSP